MTLVTRTVLFSRKNNENITTRLDPVGEYVPGTVDLEATGTFCRAPDDDGPVTGKLYSVEDVDLPEWLSANEWARNFVRWKFLWGHGADLEWPEAWQRGLLHLNSAEKTGCIKLLRTKKFRSEFRKSLYEQLVAWLETPADERKYSSPFSPKQWGTLINRWTALESKRVAESLYWKR